MNDPKGILDEVKKAVVGKDGVLVMALLAILAGGHILLEDIPGVGKTTMALAFSKALSLKYNRVQFTPDVLPSDIVGFSVYNKATGAMEYLPYRYQRNCVVYTGTHDNETLRGWIDSILPVERKQVCEYLDVRTKDPQEIVEKMIIAAFGSVADYCIIPLQDYLGLDNSARINQPSTNGKNWKWRVNKKDLSAKLAGRIAALTALYGRMPEEN